MEMVPNGDRPVDMRTFLEELNGSKIRAYSVERGLIKEHCGIEETVLAGGYGYRQILELVQNGADAILEAEDQGRLTPGGNRIDVVLRQDHLYVANTGSPLTREGVDALLRSHCSTKRRNQIGRFGLGFKSLLRLDGCIDLFTRASGAIRFDPQRCRRELMQSFQTDSAPRLRLAWFLDEAERAADPVCSEFAWAETIVRVAVAGKDEIREHLRQEIRVFPAEFLLFFPVMTVLTLDDGIDPPRVLKLEFGNNNDRILHDGSGVSRWRLWQREAAISDPRALADATHIHARETVPLAWAVPLEGRREEAGRFWAFFPTHTPTYLPGILNAPWKLNSDRNAIIGGEWNAALMGKAADLVAESIPSLTTPEDPGRLLDAFPRQIDRQDEDAAPLIQALWERLAVAAVVPDATGTLRIGSALCRHPRDSVELAERWRALARPEGLKLLIHPSCLDRQRNSRLNALAERFAVEGGVLAQGMLRRLETAEWFKMIASRVLSEAIPVLELAERYSGECTHEEWSRVRPTLTIIPSDNGRLLNASQALLAPPGTNVPGRGVVALQLQQHTNTTRILVDVMKVQTPDENVWVHALDQLLEKASRALGTRADEGWGSLWVSLRQTTAMIAESFTRRNKEKIRVRRADGAWVFRDELVLPGSLIQAHETTGNTRFIVDIKYHASDLNFLKVLDVSEFPVGNSGPSIYCLVAGDCKDLEPWLSAARQRYRREASTRRKPQEWFLQPSSLKMPTGWKLLAQLVGAPNAKLTEAFRDRLLRDRDLVALEFGHYSQPDVYPRLHFPHPLLWFLLRYGTFTVGGTTVRLSAVMARRGERALLALPDWEVWNSTFDVLEDAFPAIPAVSMSEVREVWLALIDLLAKPSSLEGDELAELWAAAARDGVIPSALPSKGGRVELSAVFVTASPDLARRARNSERVVVMLDEVTLRVWIRNGAKDLAQLLKPAWSGAEGPAQLLTAVIPELSEVLRPELRSSASCQMVSELCLLIDHAEIPIPCLLWQGSLLLDVVQLSALSRADRLRMLLEEICPAAWIDDTVSDALRRLGDAQVEKLRSAVASGVNLAERLLRAVGNRRSPLYEALGPLRDKPFITKCQSIQLAELTLAQLGPTTLSALRETLDAEGLNPPSRWNTSEARVFVNSLGFPVEFASAPASRREAEEIVSGPIELPPLHDFQEETMQGLQRLLSSGEKRRRAIVSLPTGGGKTRVTVEAAVRLILAPESTNRSIVWIAQTDELCEQAVQAFRQVWVNIGAQGIDLRVIRLWGGNPNPAVQDLSRPVAVIASIQTLNSRIGTEGLDWLNRPGLVVVDECHHAITPSYTYLLRWLDAAYLTRSNPIKYEPPIIGLSATPFRKDEQETERLAKRFDNRWLPTDQAHLHARLLNNGVLAQAEYNSLESGVSLLDDEIHELARFQEWEGLNFENIMERINQRLGGDADRNLLLLSHIANSSGYRSILFFTNSVQHADEMSARLNLEGIPSAAVSGNTSKVTRRYFLDRFQRGDLRVLCNHSVLTTGFDAPRTDMVLIARQVFSPVRYMQMVGRGLRGEKNGGTPRCRIVTVLDNLGRFQNRHPYYYCQKYYSAS